MNTFLNTNIQQGMYSVITRIFYFGVHRTHREAKRGSRVTKEGQHFFKIYLHVQL